MQRSAHNLQRDSSHKPFIVPVFIPHYGCPHRCIFCNQERITAAGPMTSLDPSDIQKQIADFLKFRGNTHRRTQISFYGGNFLGLPRKEIRLLLDIATSFIRSGDADGIRFSTRPDTVRPETLSLVRDYPVETVEIGVQSLDDRVLQKSHRGHTAGDSTAALRLLRASAFEVGAQMMIGLPGEGRDSAISSAKQIADVHPDFVRIYPTVVIAESVLERLYTSGGYRPLSLEEAVTTTKLIKHIFDRANIPVVRMGLQATQELCNEGNIVAGPWHPSFGEMVQSEIYLDLASAKLSSFSDCRGKTAVIRLHPKAHSAVRGLKNANISALKKRFQLLSVQIREDAAMDRRALDVSVNGFGFGTT